MTKKYSMCYWQKRFENLQAKLLNQEKNFDNWETFTLCITQNAILNYLRQIKNLYIYLLASLVLENHTWSCSFLHLPT